MNAKPVKLIGLLSLLAGLIMLIAGVTCIDGVAVTATAAQRAA